MEKEFVPYELALDLKELGFDEPCFATYRTHAVGSKKPFEYDLDYHTKVEMSSNVIPINSEYTEESKWISAPLYQQAFRWFRKKYKLYVNITYDWNDEMFRVTIMKQNQDKSCKIIHLKENDYITEYKYCEEAELKCLKKLIEIVKEKK